MAKSVKQVFTDAGYEVVPISAWRWVLTLVVTTAAAVFNRVVFEWTVGQVIVGFVLMFCMFAYFWVPENKYRCEKCGSKMRMGFLRVHLSCTGCEREVMFTSFNGRKMS